MTKLTFAFATVSTIATATTEDIKFALTSMNAIAGVPSAMRFDGWKKADLAIYADRVKALRDAGYEAPVTPNTITAAEQQLEADRAEAARAAVEAGQTTSTTSTRTTIASMAVTLAQLTAGSGVAVLTVADRMALGFATSSVAHRAYWAPCNPGGKAAARAGLRVSTTKSADGFTLVLSVAA